MPSFRTQFRTAPLRTVALSPCWLVLILWTSPAACMEIPEFIFAGQSNAVGASTSPDELTGNLANFLAQQYNVLFYGPNHETLIKTWGPLQPPTETAQAITGPPGNTGFGPELSAGRDLQLATGG